MSERNTGYLAEAYDLDTPDKTKAHYGQWAATYEQELGDNSYTTPARCASALAAHAPDLTAPVVDLGCGTGLSGLALQEAGFTNIAGLDYSEEMLALAREKSGVYTSLGTVDLSVSPDIEPGTYTHACAAGVINPGHVPAEAIGFVLGFLPPGGCFSLSLNDHALTVPEFSVSVHRAVGDGTAELLFAEYGDHLPGINLRSMVYVLRRTGT